MSSPFLEAAYLVQAFVAALEALQIPTLLFPGHVRGVYSFVYLLPLPSLSTTNKSQCPLCGPSPRATPPVHHPGANQDPQPIPQADPALRTGEKHHCYRALGLVPYLKHRGVVGPLLQHRNHHPFSPLYQVCLTFSFWALPESSLIPFSTRDNMFFVFLHFPHKLKSNRGYECIVLTSLQRGLLFDAVVIAPERAQRRSRCQRGSAKPAAALGSPCDQVSK